MTGMSMSLAAGHGMWNDAYKRTLAANQKKVAHVAAAGFLSHYLSGLLP